MSDVAEVEIQYEADELGIKVTSILGEASIVVEHSWDGAEAAATLVNSLPQILVNVEEALQQQEDA